MQEQLKKLQELSETKPEMAVKIALDYFARPPKTNASKEARKVLAKGKDVKFKSGIAATEWGTGKTIALFHGWGAQRGRLYSFVEPLLQKGFRVIAVDARAHGDSVGEKTNAVDYSEMILELVPELGDVYAAIGHSMGAGALVYAIYKGFYLQRAVLLAGAYNWEYQIKFFAKSIGFSDELQDAFFNHIRSLRKEIVDISNVAPLAKDFEQKALIFHSQEDERVPFVDSELLAKYWKGSEFVVLDGLGHSNLLEDKAVVAKTVDFLS